MNTTLNTQAKVAKKLTLNRETVRLLTPQQGLKNGFEPRDLTKESVLSRCVCYSEHPALC